MINTELKPTRTIDQCLAKLPEHIAKRLRADKGCPIASASSLGASCWIHNSHSGEEGELHNILIHSLAELKQIKASWYLIKGGTNAREHLRLLEKCFVKDSKYHGQNEEIYE